MSSTKRVLQHSLIPGFNLKSLQPGNVLGFGFRDTAIARYPENSDEKPLVNLIAMLETLQGEFPDWITDPTRLAYVFANVIIGRPPNEDDMAAVGGDGSFNFVRCTVPQLSGGPDERWKESSTLLGLPLYPAISFQLRDGQLLVTAGSEDYFEAAHYWYQAPTARPLKAIRELVLPEKMYEGPNGLMDPRFHLYTAAANEQSNTIMTGLHCELLWTVK